MFNKLSKFCSDVKAEMKKVSWSTKSELIGSTWIVIISVLLLMLFIGIIDFSISRAISFVIR